MARREAEGLQLDQLLVPSSEDTVTKACRGPDEGPGSQHRELDQVITAKLGPLLKA